jgi:3-isopropylmalate/(R)-2-methylmalate dehydratase small subunit
MGNKLEIKGRAWRFDDNISTDDIISGVHLAKLTIEEITPYTFETLRPEFAQKVQPNDLIVGGRNFGVGSSREEAPAILQELKIGAVIAASFARIFFRNAFNIGLPAIEVPALAHQPDLIRDGDSLHLRLQQGILHNHRTNQTLEITRIPSFLLKYLQAGGAIQLLKQKLANK